MIYSEFLFDVLHVVHPYTNDRIHELLYIVPLYRNKALTRNLSETKKKRTRHLTLFVC